MDPASLQKSAEKIVSRLRSADHVALFAGGCVRDMLSGRAPKDIDLATDAPPERVISLFRRTKKVGAKFGVVMVRIAGHDFEVATFRTEGDYADHRRPGRVEFSTAERDAQRRDFTINGMFYDPVVDEVIDYVGGRKDLDARLIRAIGDPQERFEEDHLRMLRAVRFAARLGFDIEPDTFSAIRRCADRIRSIAPERIRMEIEQIFVHPSRQRGWELMVELNLAHHLVDGLHWSDAERGAVARRLSHLPANAGFTLAMAALLRDKGPTMARSVCLDLRFSCAETDAVTWLLNELPSARRSDDLELADIKLLRADARFADLLELLRADLTAQHIPLDAYTRLVDWSARIHADDVAPPPLVTGDDLLAMDLLPGPRYGEILSAVYRAQLNETVRDREAALRLARQMAEGAA